MKPALKEEKVPLTKDKHYSKAGAQQPHETDRVPVGPLPVSNVPNIVFFADSK